MGEAGDGASAAEPAIQSAVFAASVAGSVGGGSVVDRGGAEEVEELESRSGCGFAG